MDLRKKFFQGHHSLFLLSALPDFFKMLFHLSGEEIRDTDQLPDILFVLPPSTWR